LHSAPEDCAQETAFGEVAAQLIASGLGFRFQAKGRSMLPTIQDGEILHVCPADPASIKLGEVILFRDCNGFKAHRVIRKKSDLFTTRGDSSAQADDEILSEQIVGKVTAKECAETGEIISLEDANTQFRFFMSEARKQISGHLRRASTFLLAPKVSR